MDLTNSSQEISISVYVLQNAFFCEDHDLAIDGAFDAFILVIVRQQTQNLHPSNQTAKCLWA